jgi:AraC-like DNA-binding protein
MHYLDYIENATHGTPDFPLALYRVDETHPRYEMPFHWHREMEIIHVVRGRFTLYLDDKMILADQGDIVFINQGVIHGGTPDDCVYECVVFDPYPLLMHTDICRHHIRFLTDKDIHIYSLFPAGTQPLCDITDRLISAAGAISPNASPAFGQQNAPGSELSALGALFEWFGYIYETHSYTKNDTAEVPDSGKIQILKPVLAYIDQTYMQSVTLEDLAKLAGMSPRYFCRFFHALIHRTPMDYLSYYRVERACHLLAATSVTVTETAYRCGFNDSSYFVKIFKKYKGTTPRQYRKQFQK